MKKMLKKILIIILIFLTINSFIITNTCYGADGGILETIGAGIIGIFAYPIQILLRWGGAAINLMTAGVAYIDGAVDGTNTSAITPFDILFNKVKLLDVNFFDFDTISDDSIVGKIRTGIATWYYVLRLIATAILLVILIYVGIRMALSTVASDKAMYKKMLIDWTVSILLIFVLQYIMIFVFRVNSALISAMENLANSTNVTSVSDSFDALYDAGRAFGITGIGSAAVYFILVTQTIGLLISYINRMLKVAFLMIISPLITLTYSIDKMGDGKAQALNSWLKEFIFTILMQPFHCIIYMVMISTALNLLADNTTELGYAVLAIVCIRFVQEGEKIVRKIFHFEDDNSGTSVAAGMAMSAMALSHSKNIGKTLKSGVTTAKNLKTNATNFINHAKTDAMVMGAIVRGNNTKKETVTVRDENGNEVKDKDGKTKTEEIERKMTYAELKEDALAKQVDKQADKIAKKVYGRYAGESAYSGLKKEDLTDKEKVRFQQLTDSGMQDSRAFATIRKERLEGENKKKFAEEHPHRNKIITGVKGAQSTVRALNQLDVVKDLKAMGGTYISATVAAGAGLAMYGNGRDLMQSAMVGAAAFGSTNEFMKDTTKNLIDSSVQSVMALNAQNPEHTKILVERALQSDPTRFDDKNSDEFKQLLDNIKKQLMALGMDSKSTETYGNRIQQQIRKNALEGNPKSLSEIMQNNINHYNRSSAGRSAPISDKHDTRLLKHAMSQTSDFENEKVIFDNYQKVSQSSGMSAETYRDEILNGVKGATGTEFATVNSDDEERGEITEEVIKEVTENNKKITLQETVVRSLEQRIESSEIVKEFDERATSLQLSESDKQKLKDDILKETSAELETEIEKIQHELEQEGNGQIEEIERGLVAQQQEYERLIRELQQIQTEVTAGTTTMTIEEQIQNEKELMQNAYKNEYVRQSLKYIREHK